MEKKTHNDTGTVAGILIGIFLTGILSFLTSFIAEYIIYNGNNGSGNVIRFNREAGSLIVAVVGAILGAMGGAILGGVVGGIKSKKGKSALIGGLINGFILFFLGALLDAGRNAQTDFLLFSVIWIMGQALAGGIAGLLISAILNSADKEQEENYD